MAFWIISAFAAWIFAFHSFLNSYLPLSSDATSYYDHTKFFIVNLREGVFPLWDPFWFNGAPNDFFLRRIGCFNPFYLIILLFKSVGIPYTLSYLWFLALYYWGGMIAFYLLAKRLYQNNLLAYAGYLILMFSALGTRLFDSYMMLVTVPFIWFFYFLVAMTQNPRRHFFLGLILSIMILSSTYIPFYFIISASIFLAAFFLLYFKQLPEIFGRYVEFFKKNKLLVILSFSLIVLSFLPLLNFVLDSAKQVVLPLRHGGNGAGLTVPLQTVDWGAPEDFFYSFYFSNLKLYKFAVVYVPFFAMIILAIGLIGRINRRCVLIFLTGIILACCIIPHGLPFYNFLYKHLFFFKYFRNLHFFIWFFLIPLFVMLTMEHWQLFTQIKPKTKAQQNLTYLYVITVHVLALWFVWWRHDAIISTYIMIGLSFILWTLITFRRLKANFWGLALLTLTVIIQPLETYHYLALKTEPLDGTYSYNYFSFNKLQLKNSTPLPPNNEYIAPWTIYYASQGYNFVYNSVSNYSLAKYLQHKIYLVDHLTPTDAKTLNSSNLEAHFLLNDNSAFVFSGNQTNLKLQSNDPNPAFNAIPIDGVSTDFQIFKFDANHLRLKLNLPYEKFLVYNDSFDPEWHASINGRPEQILEVNGGFKGVWVPAGTNTVDFGYSYWWKYLMNGLLLIFAYMLLAGFLWTAYKERETLL